MESNKAQRNTMECCGLSCGTNAPERDVDHVWPSVKRRRLVLQNQIDGLFSALEKRATEKMETIDGGKSSSPRFEVRDGMGFKVAMVGDSTIRVSSSGGITHHHHHHHITFRCALGASCVCLVGQNPACFVAAL